MTQLTLKQTISGGIEQSGAQKRWRTNTKNAAREEDISLLAPRRLVDSLNKEARVRSQKRMMERVQVEMVKIMILGDEVADLDSVATKVCRSSPFHDMS
jgi:uncharacterized phosphosugar-binding protein